MMAWLLRTKQWVILLAALVISSFGLVTYLDLPREANPDVTIPVVTVTTPYIGVSPEDIESLVTIPIENELAGVKDLKKMTSTSAEGVSIVVLEFEAEVDISDALQRVRDRFSRAQPRLPDDVEETEIAEINFSDLPILIVTLGGAVDEVELKALGEDLEDDIRRIPGVLEADLSGGREREIQVQIDPYRLQHYQLGMGDVMNAIRDENVNIPGGDVTTGDASFLLRVPGEFDSAADIEGVAVKRVGDRPVFVSDLARVVDGFAERATYARMNGEPAVSIAVSKRGGANIVEVADEVRRILAEHQERWPETLEARILGDQSEMVDDMIGELENGIITGLLLVVGVLLFFMGVRNSLFVALAIPLSMLLAVIVIAFFDMTLNMIVLFSLIMALGMLVDNAIVLVENIFRHVEMGEDLKTASIEGTREVAGAVAASTATTVAAFFPLLFWTGVMGQFMGYLPKTIVIVLIASLIVAILILPLFTSVLMAKKVKVGEDEDIDEIDRLSQSPIMAAYRRLLELSIRFRYASIVIGILSFVFTIVAYGELNYGTEFFPETEPNRATITVRAPDGTDLETTDHIVQQIESILAAQENVDVYVAEVGVAGGGNDPMSSSQASANAARITVDFLPDANTADDGEQIRVEATTATIDRIRHLCAEIPGAEIRVEKELMGPPVGKPIEVRVAGEDVHEVGRVAARVRRELAEIPGSTDLTDDYRVGRPEMRLRIDRGAAKRVGASSQAIASTVRTAVAGTKVSTLREGDEEHDIIVTLDPAYRDDLQAVLSLRIDGKLDTAVETFPVPLSTVAHFDVAGGTGAIQHLDQDLVVTVSGDVSEGHNQNDLQEDVLEYIDATNAELAGSGVYLSLGGSNDEQKETEEFMQRAFAIAIALIAFVLVYQFNSFMTPGIILVSVVLSLIGVLWGLVIMQMPFGIMMTGLGVISLAGIVVNNAIVLLEFVEQLKEQGHDTVDALVRAGMTRFRPVVLTAITTVLGLVPMAVGVSFDFREWVPVMGFLPLPKLIVGSQSATWWGPMAIAIIFGLVVATVLTLVMVPTLYSILDDFRGGFEKVRGATRDTPSQEESPTSSEARDPVDAPSVAE